MIAFRQARPICVARRPLWAAVALAALLVGCAARQPFGAARPPPLVISATAPGADGPDLDVEVDGRDPEYLSFRVTDGERTWHATVARADAADFRVVSRGADGAPGPRGPAGRDGELGLRGASASCPGDPGRKGGPGGDGWRGLNGGEGGRGGRGGTIGITVIAAPHDREELLALVQRIVRSEGGAGGRGGAGGPGGSGAPGGRGGTGTTCVDRLGHRYTLAAGVDGVAGEAGSPGRSGPPGEAGAPGRLLLRVGEPGPSGSVAFAPMQAAGR